MWTSSSVGGYRTTQCRCSHHATAIIDAIRVLRIIEERPNEGENGSSLMPMVTEYMRELVPGLKAFPIGHARVDKPFVVWGHGWGRST